MYLPCLTPPCCHEKKVFWVLTCLICKFSNLHQGKNRWHSYNVLNTLVCFKPCINPPFGGLVMAMYLDLWGVFGPPKVQDKKDGQSYTPEVSQRVYTWKIVFWRKRRSGFLLGPCSCHKLQGVIFAELWGEVYFASHESHGVPQSQPWWKGVRVRRKVGCLEPLKLSHQPNLTFNPLGTVCC